MIEQDPPPPKREQPALPLVVCVLIAANLIAFALSVSAGADPLLPTPDQIFAHGGNFGPVTLGGEWWRLVSSMFLHYGFIHLASNMFSLFVIGRHVERSYGRAAFLALYVFSGLTGSLASALPSKAVSAGASGAVFGVMGGLAAYLFTHRATLDKDQLANQTKWLGIILGLNLMTGLRVESIDMFAHVGGFVGGLAAGMVLAKPTTKRVLAVVVASGLVIVAANLIPPPKANVVLAATKEKADKFAAIESKVLDRYNELVKEQKANEDEIANIIESEILPEWRKAKEIVWSMEYLPGDKETHLRAYVETRERAWVAMVAALRKQDSSALAEAMNTMTEAEKYIEKLSD